MEPAVLVGWDIAFDTEWLEASEERRESSAFGRDADGCASRPAWPPLPRSPLGRAGELRRVTLDELEATTRSTGRIDGNAGTRECIDVAQHCPLGDLQSFGELGRGEATMLLEDQHDGEQSPSTHDDQYREIPNA